ncbi:MAG: response regulator [Planctomycetaceae bacterium]|jgi:CheY-like chemotaxis protein/nitrogen-specific signal transduction histidine kinase|nr:response regulator [Planctomycetaceae bacterium]
MPKNKLSKKSVADNKPIEVASNTNSEMSVLPQVAHEIRTPLTAILGYAEFITNQAISLQECRDAASIILDNSDYLLKILDDLLEADESNNLSNESIKNLADKKQQVDIPNTIHGVYRMFSNAATAKKLFFMISCSTPIPRFIVTKIIPFRQILVNLVSNAIKFTLTGGVRIILSWQKNNLHESDFIAGVLRIDVCDSGIGISPEVLPQLFTPYQQADHTIKTRFGGTGLGLAISQKIANKLGGGIIVTNNIEGGSTFSFLLPVKLEGEVEFISDLLSLVDNYDAKERNVESKYVVEDGENESDEKCLLTGCRVLLVEDSEEVQRLLGFILTKVGAIVEYAGDGKTAFDVAVKGKFDVILIDVGLPIEDGYSAVQRLRNNGYRGQIIALTADNSIENKKKSKQAGCNDFVTKPILRNELIKIIQENCSKFKKQQ